MGPEAPVVWELPLVDFERKGDFLVYYRAKPKNSLQRVEEEQKRMNE